ncbi:MAG: hypothetical protein ABWY63_14195 [Hyphomicrobiaceae bacterium]
MTTGIALYDSVGALTGGVIDNFASRMLVWGLISQVPATPVVAGGFGISSLRDDGVGITMIFNTNAFGSSPVCVGGAHGLNVDTVAVPDVTQTQVYLYIMSTGAMSDGYPQVGFFGTLA